MNGVLHKWKQRWRRAMRNRVSARELEVIGPVERMRLPDDVGLGGTDLRRFHCRHSGPTQLMPRRLQEMGVDPAYVKYEFSRTYRDLERVCARCKSAGRCARDLARGDVQIGMESYCLNS